VVEECKGKILQADLLQVMHHNGILLKDFWLTSFYKEMHKLLLIYHNNVLIELQ
jgi:hypothetical protein